MKFWRFTEVRTATPVAVVVTWCLVCTHPFVSIAKDASDEFGAHLERIEATVAEGDYKSAKRKAAKFEREMLDRIIGGPRVPEYLGEIARLHAIALAGVGEMDHAAWKWQIALAISPETTDQEFDDFGDVGRDLQAFIRTNPVLVDPANSMREKGSQPVPTKQPTIRYPKAQGKLKLHGSVVVQIVIGIDGKPYNPQIVKLSGRPIMAYSTLVGLRRWRFEPSMVDGTPVNSFMTITMRF